MTRSCADCAKEPKKAHPCRSDRPLSIPNLISSRLTSILIGVLLCSTSFLTYAQNSTTIIGVATETPTFSTLLNAIDAAGLTETLERPGPYTVFAPTNDAFAKLSETELSALLADREALQRVLDYHIVPGSYTTSEITPSMRETGFTTLLGDTLPITERGVGNATVTTVNIPASNGVLFAIDTVLTPPALPVSAEPDTDTPDTDITDPAETLDSSDETRARFNVTEVGGSGVSGSVLMTELSEERSIVTLSLSGLSGGEYPSALYAGTCATLSEPSLFDLETYQSDLGFSTTVVALPYPTLIGEQHALVVRAATDASAVVACGEVGR